MIELSPRWLIRDPTRTTVTEEPMSFIRPQHQDRHTTQEPTPSPARPGRRPVASHSDDQTGHDAHQRPQTHHQTEAPGLAQRIDALQPDRRGHQQGSHHRHVQPQVGNDIEGDEPAADRRGAVCFLPIAGRGVKIG